MSQYGMNMRIKEIAYHRNGVAGVGFNVVRFDWRDDDGDDHRMVATIFPESGTISVLDIDELHLSNIAFAEGNSWRGDDFEPELRLAIEQQDEQVEIDRAVEHILKSFSLCCALFSRQAKPEGVVPFRRSR